jgi:hypothetical protein
LKRTCGIRLVNDAAGRKRWKPVQGVAVAPSADAVRFL